MDRLLFNQQQHLRGGANKRFVDRRNKRNPTDMGLAMGSGGITRKDDASSPKWIVHADYYRSFGDPFDDKDI